MITNIPCENCGVLPCICSQLVPTGNKSGTVTALRDQVAREIADTFCKQSNSNISKEAAELLTVYRWLNRLLE